MSDTSIQIKNLYPQKQKYDKRGMFVFASLVILTILIGSISFTNTSTVAFLMP